MRTLISVQYKILLPKTRVAVSKHNKIYNVKSFETSYSGLQYVCNVNKFTAHTLLQITYTNEGNFNLVAPTTGKQ